LKLRFKNALAFVSCFDVCFVAACEARAVENTQADRFDVFRWLNAARDSLRVRASRINAIEAAWLARIELERAGGEVKS